VGESGAHIHLVWKSDIICPECGAGYRRIVITSCEGVKGEYRCLTCNHVLEVFDGAFEVLIRLTVPPVKTRNDPVL
jgi:DNA-directed RNA polymerase subunit RPC12/RpoP